MMPSAKTFSRLAILAACLAPLSSFAQSYTQAATPIVTDSRIKTFVYNENDVFNILTHYGYQSNIEFGRSEEVQTISVGDRFDWQIVPSGRRLFIRALVEGAHTNMTVVTNKRAYQFDLTASGKEPIRPSEELVYVVRFFYPDEKAPAPDPMYSDSVMPAPPAPMPVSQPQGINYQYTYSGSPALAPLKIYDDGQATYFKMRGSRIPAIAAVDGSGSAVPQSPVMGADNTVRVPTIAPRFQFSQGAEQLTVYNERLAR